MMFDRAIKTFLTAAKEGSFNRAAEKLYLSPNGVKKRITQLEQQINVILFDRTAKGLSLTNAGQALYEEFSRLDLQAEAALQRARQLQQQENGQLRIGISTVFSDFFLTNQWYEIRQHYRQVHLSFFGSRKEEAEELLRNVGKTIDLAVELYEPAWAKQFALHAQPVSSHRFCIGVPAGEPLPIKAPAAPGEPAFVDQKKLAGSTLCLLAPGRAPCFDEVRAALLAQCPTIQPVDLEEYSIRTISSCLSQGSHVLMTENMTDLFPFYSFPMLAQAPRCRFGIFSAAHPGKQEKEFIRQVLHVPVSH